MFLGLISIRRLLVLLVFVLTARLAAHPMPEIRIRGFFESGGQARFEVEIAPQSFAANPHAEPYLLHSELRELPAGERTRLLERAVTFIRESVAFHFEPTGRFAPAFTFQFAGVGGAELQAPDDIVKLIGHWRTELPAGVTGYWIEALPEGVLRVAFLNTIDEERVRRVNHLFPGESSFVLDLSGLGGVEAKEKEELRRKK